MINLYSLLPESFADEEIPVIIEEWLEVVEPPIDDAGNRCYPYTVFDDVDSETGTTTNLERVKELFVEYGAGFLGMDVDGTDKLSYKDLEIVLSINEPPENNPTLPSLNISISTDFFDPESSYYEGTVENNIGQTIELALVMAQRFDTLYTLGFEEVGVHSSGYYPDRREIEAGTADDLYWLTVVPPSIVDQWGRERVLDAPAWRVEELDDGSVLLVTFPNPTEADGEAHKAVADHLGLTAHL